MTLFLAVTAIDDFESNFLLTDGRRVGSSDHCIAFGHSAFREHAVLAGEDWLAHTQLLLVTPSYLRENIDSLGPVLKGADGVFIHPGHVDSPSRSTAISAFAAALPPEYSDRSMLEGKTVAFSIGSPYPEYQVEALSKIWSCLNGSSSYQSVVPLLANLGTRHREMLNMYQVSPAILVSVLLQGIWSDAVAEFQRTEWGDYVKRLLEEDYDWMLSDPIMGLAASDLVNWFARNVGKSPGDEIPPEVRTCLEALRLFVRQFVPTV